MRNSAHRAPRNGSGQEVWRSLWQAGVAVLAVTAALGAMLGLGTYYAARFLVAGIEYVAQ